MSLSKEIEPSTEAPLYEVVKNLPLRIPDSQIPSIFLMPGETVPGFVELPNAKIDTYGESSPLVPKEGNIVGHFLMEGGGEYPVRIEVRPERLYLRAYARIRGREPRNTLDIIPIGEAPS